MRLPVWVLALAGTGHLFLGAQDSKAPDSAPAVGSISGRVVEQGNGDAIQGANVELLQLGVSRRITFPPGGPRPPIWPTVSSDAEGKFRFTGLEKGKYFIRVEKPGFADAFYRSNPNLNEAANLDLTAGAHMENLTIYMMRATRLSGKVTTREGHPVSDAEVACLFKTYRHGIAELYPATSATTSGKGEYAFDALSPGQYYLFVAPFANAHPVSPTSEGVPAISVAHGFYPSGDALDAAIPIEVNAGIDIPDANIILREGPSYRVSGGVTAPASQERMVVQLHESSSEVPSGPLLATRSVSPPDYKFSFENVPSGQYIITVRPSSKPTTLWSAESVFVSKSDISGLRLDAGPARNVTGVIKADSKPPFSLKDLAVRLTNMDLFPPPPRIESEPLEDGTFALREVSPGRSILDLSGLPKSWFVKCVSLSRQPCSPAVLNLTSDVGSATLDITIASPAASVSGKVTDDGGKAVPLATVVLWPDRREDGPSVAKSDGDGAYAFQGLAPGSYTLYSWAAIEQFRVQDPAFIAQNKSRGETIHLNAGDSVQKNIIAIAAAR